MITLVQFLAIIESLAMRRLAKRVNKLRHRRA
jgi:hypothetical protein